MSRIYSVHVRRKEKTFDHATTTLPLTPPADRLRGIYTSDTKICSKMYRTFRRLKTKFIFNYNDRFPSEQALCESAPFVRTKNEFLNKNVRKSCVFNNVKAAFVLVRLFHRIDRLPITFYTAETTKGRSEPYMADKELI